MSGQRNLHHLHGGLSHETGMVEEHLVAMKNEN
jgi:hypothetical protein